MHKGHKQALTWLGISTLLGVGFGLFFGYQNKHYLGSFIIAFSISYTIWFFMSLLHIFLIPRIEHLPRGRKLCLEIPCFLIADLLGFLIPMSIFSKVYGFSFFASTVFWTNMGIFLVIALIFFGLIYSFMFYRELKEKEATEEKFKALAAEAKLKALKAQINPHFLFNSLNSINALVTQNPKLARQMIARLSELLRMSLENRDKLLVPLKEELDVAHTYLGIERIRFSDKMNYHEEVDPELLGTPFPAMVLQPLLENAVKHGIANSRRGGTIQLILKRRGDQFWCKISNEVEKINTDQNPTLSVNGTGLTNIRQRLNLLYGKNYYWQTGYSPSGKFEVILSLPLESNEQD